MRSPALPLVAASFAATLALPSLARAQYAVAPSEELPPPQLPDYFIKEGAPQRTLALEVNPIALVVGMFSMNVEYMIVPHHVVVLSPSYTYAIPGRSDSITGGGIEAGYRYYTGTRSPSGWFLGTSFLYGRYDYVYRASKAPDGTCYAFQPPENCPQNTAYDSYGLAVDGGYQFVLKDGIVIGGGLGLAYHYFTDQPQYGGLAANHPEIDRVYGSGLRPRILFSFGGAL